MKRVLFMIPTLTGGGAERVLITLVNNLDSTKYDITLFSIFDVGINKKYLNKNIKYEYYFKKIFKGNIHFLKLYSPKSLYQKMIKQKYDIAISYLEGPSTRIIGGCPDENTKLLNWVHTEIDNSKDIVRSYRNINEFLKIYNLYDVSVFVSNTAYQAFKKTFTDITGEMLVKYNTVDTKSILLNANEKIDDLKFDESKMNLISVGRFTHLKGFLRLMKVFKSLIVEDKFKLHLYILGEGELESKYKEYISENSLNEHITILGYKDNPYKYIKNCDLFVCSSYKEGYSTAVTESLIVGTPVVTTLCSGMEELLGSNNEFGIITSNSDSGLYEGIKSILTEPGLLKHYKEKATERSKYFSIEKSVNSIEEMLDAL